MGWTPLGKLGTNRLGTTRNRSTPLVDVEMSGILDLMGQGMIRTARDGQRIEITTENGDRITFFSGSAGETTAAYIQSWDVGPGVPHLRFYGPSDGVNVSGSLDLFPGEGWLYGGNKAGLGATGAGGGTVVMTIDGGAPVFRPNVADATIDLGSPTMAWLDSYIETMYSDRGDGTYVEAAPRGTLLKYGFDGSGTNRAMPGGAVAEIIVTGGGSAITVACEYVGQVVLVDVTIMGTVSGITAGEWWYLVPWVNGASASGWVIQYNEALSSVSYAHAAGAAPGFAHSAGGTGNTGDESSHTHQTASHAIAGTSGPASAGTAHTHTVGTYNDPIATTGGGSAHNHTGPSHSDHGTHTIADHAGHTHATTYDGTWTGRWVGEATADASKNVVLSIGGTTQTTAATLNQHSLAYMVWRL